MDSNTDNNRDAKREDLDEPSQSISIEVADDRSPAHEKALMARPVAGPLQSIIAPTWSSMATVTSRQPVNCRKQT